MKWFLVIWLGILGVFQFVVSATFLFEPMDLLRKNLNIPFVGQFEAVSALVMVVSAFYFLVLFDKRKA